MSGNGSRKFTVLMVGGKPFNVPPEFYQHFDLVKHIEQDSSKPSGSLPNVDYIVVLTNWVDHSTIEQVKRKLPGTPVVYVQKGWNAMRAEFERRGIIKPSGEPTEARPQVVIGIPQDIADILERHRAAIIKRDKCRDRILELENEIDSIKIAIAELNLEIERLAPVAGEMTALVQRVRGLMSPKT